MKTEINDKVCESIGLYLSNKNCVLIDLDLSRNLISDPQFDHELFPDVPKPGLKLYQRQRPFEAGWVSAQA